MSTSETTQQITLLTQDDKLDFRDNEIISKSITYARLFKQSVDATTSANEAEFNQRVADSNAHSLHMESAVSHFKSENSYEMGFQTKHEDNGEQVNKEIEHDAEWAKLQVGVAEAEYKKLSLEAERIESNLEQSESDLLDFLREISADL